MKGSIMKNSITSFLVTALLPISFVFPVAASDVFSAPVLQQLQQQHENKRWLLLMWSLDCPPCFKELAAVAKLKSDNPDIPIVLVNTDDDSSMTQEREQVISSMGLTDVPSYYFPEQQSTALRYVIDSKWHGELPRSFFYTKAGQQKGHSGLLKGEQIKTWLLAK